MRSISRAGFTIVELLIVIVVIAILAAISVVAYNGIQDRAADSAVQSDLRSIAMKVMEYNTLHGEYPSGGGTMVFPANIKHRVDKQNYEQTGVNLYYCTVYTGSDARFGLAAKSRSGKIFAYYSGGFQNYSGGFSASTNICPALGIPTTEANYEFHYGKSSAGVWAAWTEG